MERGKPSMTGLVRNPDVVLREEDEDGGLLFNPDTNQIRVINATGLLVWSLLDGKHDLSVMISALGEAFEDVPEDEVEGQVLGFVEQMTEGGFISTDGPTET